MSSLIRLSALFAQTEIVDPESNTKAAIVAIVLAVLLVGPFLIGRLLARSWRLPDYWWKFGLMISSVALATTIVIFQWPPPMGIDLEGGVILIYQVDREATKLASKQADGSQELNMKELMNVLIPQIRSRIDPSGNQQIDVRRYGTDQIEIAIPVVDQIEIARIKRRLEKAGALEFRIVANRNDHLAEIDAAIEQAEGPNANANGVSMEVDGKNKIVARWVRAARDRGKGRERNGLRPFKLSFSGREITRDSGNGRILNDIPMSVFQQENDDYALPRYLASQGIEEIDVLMWADDGWDVVGSDLGSVRTSFDQTLNPCVNFSMRGSGSRKFAGLTGTNLPDRSKSPPLFRHLGIILDGELISAPRIQDTIRDRGQITGRFTQEEVDDLVNVLQAGRLPATLQKEPISENEIGPTLGADTIRRGTTAIGVSLIAVLLFILVYYRFAGVVACAALLANLLMILAVMIIVRQDLTLPGLAGLVLTVGMSVDANVLIFERIREERLRGGGLRMAIRNGFSRATTTIVDANLTTLITAIVLYAIGTETVRGFAVTLILGIMMSMFTAIFCSRVIFEVAERKRWLTELKMMRLITQTNFDFVSKQKIAAVVSLILIAIGVGAVVQRQRDIFDIDFNGGVSVTMLTTSPLKDADVRADLDKKLSAMNVQYTVTRIDVEGNDPGTTWRIDASMEKQKELQDILQATFPVTTYTMNGDFHLENVPLKQLQQKPNDTAEPAKQTSPLDKPPQKAGDQNAPKQEPPKQEPPKQEPPKQEPPKEGSARADLPRPNLVASAVDNIGLLFVQAETDEPKTEEPKTEEPKTEEPKTEEPKTEEPKTEEPKTEEPKTEEPKTEEPKTEEEVGTVQDWTESLLTFGHAINRETLEDQIGLAAESLNTSAPPMVPTPKVEDPKTGGLKDDTEWKRNSLAGYKTWKVRFNAGQEKTGQILDALRKSVTNTPVWLSANTISGKVAGDMQQKAIVALLASLLGIIAYIWIRFQRVVFGLAAVVALVHDVLITLGAIAISKWLTGPLGFLLIDEFKISLPIVAAFLTIIGYSLNDTIVVFDRIREVRGRSPDLTVSMVNASLNLTLSRTMLTSITTLLVVGILYAAGGQGIHGFAFALLVGVVVGTYSSVFVASPVLLWMTKSRKPAAKGKESVMAQAAPSKG